MVNIRPQLLHQLKTSEFVQWSAVTSSVTITVFKDQNDKAATWFFPSGQFSNCPRDDKQYCCFDIIVVNTVLLCKQNGCT